MIRTYDRLGHCLCLWHGLSDLVIFFFFRWQHLYLLSLYQLSSIRTRNHMLLLGRLMESVGERAWSATTGQHIRLTSEHNFGSYFRALFGRNFKGLSRACFRIFVVNLLFVTKFLTLLSCFPVVSNQYQSDREVYWCDVTTFVVCWLMFVMAVVISSRFDTLSWFHKIVPILLACGLGCCFEPSGVWPWQWKMLISVCLTTSGCSVIRPAGSEGVATHRESQWPQGFQETSKDQN